MSKKQFSQEQKLKILESAEKLGARPAADIAGIHYTMVYGWRNQLRRQGITISIRTVRRIMQANGYQIPGKKKHNQPCQRFEATRPLELAQMDILEFFINKLKIYLILLLDDHSRFILGFRLLESTSVDAVIEVVAQAVDRYGKMEEILTDRGFVFYS